MVAVVEAATALVLTVNVALLAPAATVTLEGTLAAVVLLLASTTCAPPAGAGPLSVTVPVEEFPPVTLVGFSESEERETDAAAEEDSSKSRTAGLAPSAANSPEKTVTPKPTGLVAWPAYAPFSEVLVKDTAVWASPTPNKTLT